MNNYSKSIEFIENETKEQLIELLKNLMFYNDSTFIKDFIVNENNLQKVENMKDYKQLIRIKYLFNEYQKRKLPMNYKGNNKILQTLKILNEIQ